jgi:hypothetical protein
MVTLFCLSPTWFRFPPTSQWSIGSQINREIGRDPCPLPFSIKAHFAGLRRAAFKNITLQLLLMVVIFNIFLTILIPDKLNLYYFFYALYAIKLGSKKSRGRRGPLEGKKYMYCNYIKWGYGKKLSCLVIPAQKKEKGEKSIYWEKDFVAAL